MKYQLLGASKASKGVGHKLSLAAGLGSNHHEIESSPTVKFDLSAQEFQLLYGFRLGEMVLLYSNFSYSSYLFSAEVASSDPAINGLKPYYKAVAYGVYGGMELDLGPFVGKLECGYQQIKVDYTKEITQFFLKKENSVKFKETGRRFPINNHKRWPFWANIVFLEGAPMVPRCKI